jgi:hypothetical protein
MAAFITAGVPPTRVLVYIASGVFGTPAFSGDWTMALWGLFFHFIIAFSFTVLFFLVYPKLPLLRHWLMAGICYGIIVWVVMNLVVLPWSNVPKFPLEVKGVLKGMLILTLAIGLPISFMAHRYYTSKHD